MRPRRTARPVGTPLAVATLLLAAGAALAQPANDDCAAAAPLLPGVPAGGTTIGATLDQDLSMICQADASDVWFVLTADAAGPYEFTVSGQDNADLSLTLLSGCDFPMAIHGCAVGAPGAPARLEYMVFSPGELIYVRVGSLSAPGQAFTVTAGPLPPPGNDECAQAAPVHLGIPVEANNLSATTSVELPMNALCSSVAPGIAAGADVFFAFTPPSDGFYDFHTCGAVFDTVISVHSGCPVSEANAVACNDNAPLTRCDDPFNTFNSYLAGVELLGGQTYYVRVAGVLAYNSFTGELGDPGRGTFTLTVLPGDEVPVPPNDACETASPLPIDDVVFGTTVNATGAPGPCDDGTLDDVWDVWYSYTSTAAIRSVVEFQILPGAFNTQATLAAYRGSCTGELITCQYFNVFINPTMAITVAVDPGETILLRVAGFPAIQDDFALLNTNLGPAAPNAACAPAFPLTADEPALVNTFSAPTAQESPCGVTDIYPLWYTFTAPQAGYYRLATDPGPDRATTLAVYDACGGAHVACSRLGDNASPSPNAAATSLYLDAGQTVIIRAALNGPERGLFSLVAQGPLPPPPPVTNDTCDEAHTITAMPFSASVDITLAGPDQDVCAIAGQDPRPTQGGIWYRYTPDVDRVLKGDISCPGRSTLMTVFEGGCGSLTQVFCREPDQFYDRGIRLSAGVEYHILISSLPQEYQPGDPLAAIPYGTTLDISLIAPAVPANDTCAAAEPIVESDLTFSVSTLPAGDDPVTPSCATSGGGFANAVWYTFTTETAGTLTVEGVRDENADFIYTPAGALFSGGCGALTEVACDNAQSGFFLTDRFEFTAHLAAGETYYLAIGAWPVAVGDRTNVTFSYTGALAAACPADWDGNQQVNSNDISAFLTSWLASVQDGTLDADFDNSGAVNSNDISAFLTAWLTAVGSGC